MSSPKEKDYKNGKIKKNNLTTIYMKNKEKLYGTLRFNSMIPVPESELTAYKINDEGDFSYKMLRMSQIQLLQGQPRANRKDGEKSVRKEVHCKRE